MGRQIQMFTVGVTLCGWLSSLVGAHEAAAQKAPPAPPTGVRQFPKPTSRLPAPRIIHLSPGQKVITAAQLRKAPTVYQANQRGKIPVSRPTSRPAPVRVPGAPPVLHDIELHDPKPVSGASAPRKPVVKRNTK